MVFVFDSCFHDKYQKHNRDLEFVVLHPKGSISGAPIGAETGQLLFFSQSLEIAPGLIKILGSTWERKRKVGE